MVHLIPLKPQGADVQPSSLVDLTVRVVCEKTNVVPVILIVEKAVIVTIPAPLGGCTSSRKTERLIPHLVGCT
jgi:hypothetical protein